MSQLHGKTPMKRKKAPPKATYPLDMQIMEASLMKHVGNKRQREIAIHALERYCRDRAVNYSLQLAKSVKHKESA